MTNLETITILFTDLVDSTALASRVGPEATDALRKEHLGILREAVAATGGREVKNTGDGLMVTFSAAAPALECAVAIQQRHELRNRAAVDPLLVRIGIGIGDATPEDGDWFGQPVVEAARLCAGAEGGQILLTDITRIMVGRRGNHAYAPVGDVQLRGIPEPVTTCELQWTPLPRSAVPLPDRLQTLSDTDFVGRDKARGQLADAWAAAVQGDRRVALIAGEGGIGKTRLATDTALRARDEGAIVLYGHCDEEVGAAYQPWSEALQRLVDHLPSDVLDDHVAQCGGELRRLVDIAGDLPEPRSSDPETERYLLFKAVADLLDRASSQSPIVLLLDDLHWADGASLALLKNLVSSLLHAPLLILCTYRDTDLAAGHPLITVLADFRRVAGVEWLALAGLEPAEVAALIEAAAGHDLDIDGLRLAEAISRETDGNPFFVGEILRHLVESGGVVQGADGRYAVTADVDMLGLPRGIRDVVGQRVQRLGDDTERALRAGAVIGRQFDLSVLARVMEEDEDTVLDLIEPAVDAAVLRESADVPGRFIFVHALINRTLYEDTGPTRRARIHRRVGEVLEELFGGDPNDHLPDLAFHWSAALQTIDTAKAVGYAQRAGERALEQLAPTEAAQWFAQALDLLPHQSGHDEQRYELMILLGEAQRQAGAPEFKDTLLQAGRLAGRAGDPEAMTRAAIANRGAYGFSGVGVADPERVRALRDAINILPSDSPNRAMALAQLAAETGKAPDFGRDVQPLIDEALMLARSSTDLRALGHVLDMVSAALFNAGEFLDERVTLCDELRALADQIDDPNLLLSSFVWSTFLSMDTADLDGVSARVGDMRALADRFGQPRAVYLAAAASAIESLAFCRLGEAESFATEALTLGLESGFGEPLSVYGAQLSAVCLEQDRLGEVIDLFVQAAEQNPGLAVMQTSVTRYLFEIGRDDEALERFRTAVRADFALPQDNLYLQGLARWSECAVLAGDVGAAQVLYGRLHPFERRLIHSSAAFTGSSDLFLGRLAGFLGRRDAAEAHFARALALHEAIRSPLFCARTRLYWAEMLMTSGADVDASRAKDLLHHARSEAADHGGTSIVRHCAEALARIDV
jgi:class 3 adenylate cyclase/tetratricopeptide (TPR) repeat protein